MKNTMTTKLLTALALVAGAAAPHYCSAQAASDSTPSNVVLAQEYVASAGVLSNIQAILSLFQLPKGNDSQVSELTHQFKEKIVKSLRKLIQTVQTPDFTAYLKERDKIRTSALNEQSKNGGFANAYSSHAPIVDEANKSFEQIKIALQSIATADMAVTAIGENSEIKLRDRVVPLMNVALKILQ